MLASAIEPLNGAVSAYQASHTLAELANQVSLEVTIPCSPPPAASSQAQTLAEILPQLPSPALQAAAHCALGERLAASNLYSRLAATGDTWAILQSFLFSRGQSIPNDFPEIVSLQELGNAQTMGNLTDASIDWRLLIRQVVKQKPGEDAVWPIWLAEGSRLGHQNQWSDALAWYQEGLDRQKVLGVMAFRSSLALRAGIIIQYQINPPDFHQAMTFYDQALQAQRFSGVPEKISLHNYRGQALYNMCAKACPALALDEFKQALTLDEHNFDATIWMGIIYYSAYNDPRQALPWFQRAALLKENNATVYYYLGVTYTKLGQNSPAAQAFDRALQINPNWDVVRKLRQELP